MKIIKTSFIRNKQHNHNTCSHPDSEANNIDGRKNFVLPQISPGSFDIILKHGISLQVAEIKGNGCFQIFNPKMSIATASWFVDSILVPACIYLKTNEL